MNERIRVREIMLIDDEGVKIGIIPTSKALQKAKEKDLDLVEVSPNTAPPVCRIMDYSKYKYEQEKKSKQMRKKQKIMHLKELRFHPHIEEHDYNVKLNQLKKFLNRGDKVKMTMMFRGREMAHRDIGIKVMDRLIEDLKDVGELEKNPIKERRNIITFMVPKKVN